MVHGNLPVRPSVMNMHMCVGLNIYIALGMNIYIALEHYCFTDLITWVLRLAKNGMNQPELLRFLAEDRFMNSGPVQEKAHHDRVTEWESGTINWVPQAAECSDRWPSWPSSGTSSALMCTEWYTESVKYCIGLTELFINGGHSSRRATERWMLLWNITTRLRTSSHSSASTASWTMWTRYFSPFDPDTFFVCTCSVFIIMTFKILPFRLGIDVEFRPRIY